MIKYIIVLCALCISCTVNVTKQEVTKKDFLKQVEVIRQTQIKLENLSKKVAEIEKENALLTDKVNQMETKMSTTSKIDMQPKIQPIIHRNESIQQDTSLGLQNWTTEEKQQAEAIIVNFEEATENKMPNHELIGNKFPFLRFIGSNGEIVDLSEFKGKKKLVLVILRGFAGSVCLVCSSQTIALSKNIEQFHDKDTEVVLVYPGPIETVPNFINSVRNLEENVTLPFPVVLDVDLNLVNTFKINGSLAKPSTLILDKDGIVRYAYVGKNPSDRPTIPDLLNAIDEF